MRTDPPDTFKKAGQAGRHCAFMRGDRWTKGGAR